MNDTLNTTRIQGGGPHHTSSVVWTLLKPIGSQGGLWTTTHSIATALPGLLSLLEHVATSSAYSMQSVVLMS